MINYSVRFGDGEIFANCKTLEEAIETRNDNNFNFISRSLWVYIECYSKVEGCRLHHNPVLIRYKEGKK